MYYRLTDPSNGLIGKMNITPRDDDTAAKLAARMGLTYEPVDPEDVPYLKAEVAAQAKRHREKD